ncbi:Formylglycine-generating enzyme, required for sulfatase activity, contains SUMF1/FGE domain [Candidatus Desulfarcum epimagneticum]|uniref:Formylglycine-generating enzyme, required for sulfatase activity, contains SUMF1/FGE domain n=1 Tax=uncultured Desulfobacteraceae bacterium TaxID=218296 RepID=A0A484HFY6_9BACT|nr:Formylglycine-generating enzyme, required for sulfatase activity, contains SUMF1/FGE domain [uncultured Desulfobacteraceae bacterium]
MKSTQEKPILTHPAMPETFPPEFASEWGEDRKYGLWMSFEYKGVRQCFCWIKPGQFMMGSPEDEPERFDDELLHEVVLTKGFWLGETVCTQELWEAVMGDNPSRFKGKRRPVDSVSWNDCMKFIQKINSRIPGLHLRLPTEAEWEYACRAGTQTPFSFGDILITDQSNYDGKLGKTVDVKTFPCNAWGLYEMHGNVREWCFDGKREYKPGVAVDPAGSDSGAFRALRGGGWFLSGWNLRSALRGSVEPDFRWVNFGFRLAQGHPA